MEFSISRAGPVSLLPPPSQTMYSELYGKEERGYLGWNTSSTLCHVALSKLPNFIKSEISPSAKSYLPCKLS